MFWFGFYYGNMEIGFIIGFVIYFFYFFLVDGRNDKSIINLYTQVVASGFESRS